MKLACLLAALLCFTTVLATDSMAAKPLIKNTECLKNTYPVTSGGSRDEEGKCMVYDPNAQVIIMGGVTRSNNYGPSMSPHGFLYALDLDGNWMWGNYYYNRTNVVEFTGCALASDGSSVIVQGRSFNQTVLMILDSTDGSVVNFYSLENKRIGDEYPDIATFGAIYLDTKDYYDDKPYIYSAFTMRGQMQFIKLA